METFSALLALCVGNSPVTGEFPTQRPVTRSFDVDVFFDLHPNKRLRNNGEAGDLRRHRAHYDVIVMFGYNYVAQSGIHSWKIEMHNTPITEHWDITKSKQKVTCEYILAYI